MVAGVICTNCEYCLYVSMCLSVCESGAWWRGSSVPTVSTVCLSVCESGAWWRGSSVPTVSTVCLSVCESGAWWRGSSVPTVSTVCLSLCVCMFVTVEHGGGGHLYQL